MVGPPLHSIRPSFSRPRRSTEDSQINHFLNNFCRELLFQLMRFFLSHLFLFHQYYIYKFCRFTNLMCEAMLISNVCLILYSIIIKLVKYYFQKFEKNRPGFGTNILFSLRCIFLMESCLESLRKLSFDKKYAECTSQHVKWTSGAIVMRCFNIDCVFV